MATLREVAAAAGVSEATASAVLAGRARQRRIAGATAQRVRAAAERLGYRVNSAARALARGAAGVIAFAVADTSLTVLTSSFTSLIAAGVISRAHERGYGAMIAGPRQGSGEDYLEAALASVAERRCDGVVVTGLLLKPRDVELLARSPAPPVVAIDAPPGLALPAVRLDWKPAVAEAIDDLAAHGVSRVRYVGPRDERERIIAVACATRRLPCDSSRERESLAGGALRELARGERAVIIAYNDELAIRLLRVLGEQDIVVPRDLALIAFDNVAARHAVPRLASIDHRFADEGAAAVDLLLERLAAGPGFRDERVLEARYVHGASVG